MNKSSIYMEDELGNAGNRGIGIDVAADEERTEMDCSDTDFLYQEGQITPFIPPLVEHGKQSRSLIANTVLQLSRKGQQVLQRLTSLLYRNINIQIRLASLSPLDR